MMIYKSMKAMVCTTDSDNDFLKIVTDILQKDTIDHAIILICYNYVSTSFNRTNKKMVSQ